MGEILCWFKSSRPQNPVVQDVADRVFVCLLVLYLVCSNPNQFSRSLAFSVTTATQKGYIENGGVDMDHDPFKEYIKDLEPGKLERGRIWNTAIGLQDVDGLKPSKYLVDAAIGNIEGKLSLDEVRNLVDSYYEERKEVGPGEERTEEADKVSSRIAEILSESAFSFTSNEYLSIHRRLFNGIYDHAGRIRDYNITKKEWVLNGASVLYGNALDLRETLEYDLSQERAFSYKGLTMDEVIHHLSVFVSRLWQIHVFCEGNTRTTAVFFIKYLRTLGFSAANDVFADNAWYFRNSLVRANYTDIRKGVHATTEYLEAFLRNLLLDENLPLQNQNLNMDLPFEETCQRPRKGKV